MLPSGTAGIYSRPCHWPAVKAGLLLIEKGECAQWEMNFLKRVPQEKDW